MAYLTPLRYPGGKRRFAPYLLQLMRQNNLYDAHYVEPFCGGSAVAIELLSVSAASDVHLNDYDRAVWAFWHSVVNDNKALCEKIEDVVVSPEVWHQQKQILINKAQADVLELGFATFFLNRTNRSGILLGGMIGGKSQAGEWKLDVRFTKPELLKRIKAIGQMKNRIHVYNMEGRDFLRHIGPMLPAKRLTYLDPPYVVKGPQLYMNYLKRPDHAELAALVMNELPRPWLVSYDDTSFVRELYSGCEQATMHLIYSARRASPSAAEVIAFSPGLTPPTMIDRPGKYSVPWKERKVA